MDPKGTLMPPGLIRTCGVLQILCPLLAVFSWDSSWHDTIAPACLLALFVSGVLLYAQARDATALYLETRPPADPP